MTGPGPTAADVPVCAGESCDARLGLVWDSERRCWWCPQCVLERHRAQLSHGAWVSGSCSDGLKTVIMSDELFRALRGRGISVRGPRVTPG